MEVTHPHKGYTLVRERLLDRSDPPTTCLLGGSNQIPVLVQGYALENKTKHTSMIKGNIFAASS